MTARSIAKKKKRGIFYTPTKATQILCEWAIRSPRDLILEPSFGGCSFLQSSSERLSAVGCRSPNSYLFGCDIDKQSFNHLSEKIGPVDIASRFVLGDFLSLTPKDFGGLKFDVVIGNPPYVAVCDMYKSQKRTAARIAQSCQHSFRSAGSLWAYFLVHSFSFLKKGGRMAWVLPNGLIQTHYGNDMVLSVEKSCKEIFIIPLAERLFAEEGTQEASVVLLADGWGQGPAKHGARVVNVSSLQEFELFLKDTSKADRRGDYQHGNQRYRNLVSPGARAVFQKICQNPEATLLGDIADIKIGLVTGNNRFFILDQLTVKQNKLPATLFRLIYAKLGISQGVSINVSDLTRAKEENRRCLMLSTTRKGGRGTALSKYFSSYPKKMRDRVMTFGKRKIWSQPDDNRDPDAFLSYMCHIAPRLILNSAKTTSTNSIHRVFFIKRTPLYKQKLIAISALSTFTNLSAELLGRRYGEGILKLEPSEAKQLTIFIPRDKDKKRISQIFKKIDALLRRGEFGLAQTQADKFIFGGYESVFGKGALATLQATLKNIRAKRIHKGRERNEI